MTFKFVSRPGIGRLDEISEWLREEEATCDEGFYCNINVIEKAFRNKEAFCITWKNQAIGFLIYSRYKRKGRIEIAEVNPACRGWGAGRFLVENSMSTFASRGVFVVDLECRPKKSETFWRHMGFSAVPDGVDQNCYSPYNKPIVLFRPTDEAQSPLFAGGVENVVELWNCAPWDCKEDTPKWTWPVQVCQNSKDLVKPIVCPANSDWRLRCRLGSTVMFDDRMKYLPDNQRSSQFVILTRLPEREID